MLRPAHLAAALVVAVVVGRSVGGDVGDADRVVAFFMYAVMPRPARPGRLAVHVDRRRGRALGRLERTAILRARHGRPHARVPRRPQRPRPLADSTSASPPSRGPGGHSRRPGVRRRPRPARRCPPDAAAGVDVLPCYPLPGRRIVPPGRPAGVASGSCSTSPSTRPGRTWSSPARPARAKARCLASCWRACTRRPRGRITVGGTDTCGGTRPPTDDVGYVEQSSPLFRGTVRDNLTLGDPEHP